MMVSSDKFHFNTFRFYVWFAFTALSITASNPSCWRLISVRSYEPSASSISLSSTTWKSPALSTSSSRRQPSTHSARNWTSLSRTSTKRIRTISPTCSAAMRHFPCDSASIWPVPIGRRMETFLDCCQALSWRKHSGYLAVSGSEVIVFISSSLWIVSVMCHCWKNFSIGNSVSSINSSQSSHNSDKKMTLVFFIGGCTFAEISAFRYLSEAPESKLPVLVYKFISIK